MEKWGVNCREKWGQERVFMIVCCYVDAAGDSPVAGAGEKTENCWSPVPWSDPEHDWRGWFCQGGLFTIGEKAKHLTHCSGRVDVEVRF